MFLKTALIFCKESKTDAELKVIMTTHPWAGAMMHGFRKVRHDTWEEERYFHRRPDAIYIDAGLGFEHENWTVESFHTPTCSLEPWSEWEERRRLEQAWWKATTDLLLSSIPKTYQCHVVQYGEIEDEFDDAEKAWKETILGAYDYHPDIVAEFESTAA